VEGALDSEGEESSEGKDVFKLKDNGVSSSASWVSSYPFNGL